MLKKKLTQKQKGERLLEKLETGGKKVWECKIGYADCMDLPDGADSPMRKAIAKAFEELTGYEPAFIFSGWGAKLTNSEQHVISEDFVRKLKR